VMTGAGKQGGGEGGHVNTAEDTAVVARERVWEPSGCQDAQGLVCAIRTFEHGIVVRGAEHCSC
jgi:hypothetical protein